MQYKVVLKRENGMKLHSVIETTRGRGAAEDLAATMASAENAEVESITDADEEKENNHG